MITNKYNNLVKIYFRKILYLKIITINKNIYKIISKNK
jgi:hypothetical protein